MTEYDYAFSLATDLINGIDVSQLHNEINNTLETFLYINKSSTHITCKFNQELNDDDENTLNTIIANHSPVQKEVGNSKSLNINRSFISNDFWSNITTFVYEGLGVRDLNKINILCNMDEGATSYSIRIYDYTHVKELAKIEGLTNTKINEISIPVLNPPYRKSHIYIQAKIISVNNTEYQKLNFVKFEYIKIIQ